MSDFKLVKLVDGITINLDTTGVLNNYAATAAPTVNDDSGDGYTIGSHWVDTVADVVYMATDVTAGAANWVVIGSVAPPQWIDYAAHWDTPPTVNEVITGGTVYDYTLDSVTRYRFVPSPYDASLDAFYENYDSGTNTLSDLIVARGY